MLPKYTNIFNMLFIVVKFGWERKVDAHGG